ARPEAVHHRHRGRGERGLPPRPLDRPAHPARDHDDSRRRRDRGGGPRGLRPDPHLRERHGRDGARRGDAAGRAGRPRGRAGRHVAQRPQHGRQPARPLHRLRAAGPRGRGRAPHEGGGGGRGGLRRGRAALGV
ncbi:MAG: Mannose-6-phosphate isomerase, partial [uncultured Thermoleophilia bacterium]